MTAERKTARWGRVDSLGSHLLSDDTRRTFRIFVANRLSVAGLCIILTWVVIALVGPTIAPYSFEEQSLSDRLLPPPS